MWTQKDRSFTLNLRLKMLLSSRRVDSRCAERQKEKGFFSPSHNCRNAVLTRQCVYYWEIWCAPTHRGRFDLRLFMNSLQRPVISAKLVGIHIVHVARVQLSKWHREIICFTSSSSCRCPRGGRLRKHCIDPLSNEAARPLWASAGMMQSPLLSLAIRKRGGDAERSRRS